MPQQVKCEGQLFLVQVQDVFAGENGSYIFSRPSITDMADLKDILEWMEIVKRKIQRSVGDVA